MDKNFRYLLETEIPSLVKHFKDNPAIFFVVMYLAIIALIIYGAIKFSSSTSDVFMLYFFLAIAALFIILILIFYTMHSLKNKS